MSPRWGCVVKIDQTGAGARLYVRPRLRLPARSDAPPGLVYSVACREKPGSRSHRYPSRRHLGCQAQPSSPSSYSCRGTKEGIALRFDRRIDEGQSPKARVNPPLSTARPFTTHRSTDDPSRAPFNGGSTTYDLELSNLRQEGTAGAAPRRRNQRQSTSSAANAPVVSSSES